MNLFKNINFDKLKDGLSKTRDKIVTKINETITGKAKLDDELLDEIEEILITSDIGYDVAIKIIENTRVRLKVEKDRSKLNVIDAIKEELEKLLNSYDTNSEFNRMDKFKPYVILVIGVNGAGKTTTIGKLAHNYRKAGLNVIIGSADTFRAAANEQLEIWAKRAGVEIIQSTTGSDPSAVAFDTMNIAKRKNADVVLIDTAGRLHTKSNLMEELKKIKKVMSKVVDYAPNETFLVLDGNTGQNALIQAEKFREVTDITGLIITKLDGTAKGGVVFQICSQQKVPVKYIGVGEGIDDLQTFDAGSFVSALFSTEQAAG
ncbi:MAG: signal recognition particle-docking protein FtsY [Bacteroidota bacterium]|jgi:fused signal recognition particle receptor|nr:signal recognition particle-docking protein FtsY [Ignavibacteria bacterium]HEX2961031.1 signal recognition particle-docking protein FtsY [Ignavibacteriales bacterium]MCU7501232.1 signal recognition particle-docking protein FtsY [Ignavibacteria bacterium]MCU7513209.1 signal recognition particle-docking protein FtsY [Ignavibacteria bacterium]MCU7521461.1 signal recognition particle-docking protein FtsY [Ignavibacteria bacterium]